MLRPCYRTNMANEENINKLYSILIVDNEGENLEAFRLNFRNIFNITAAASGTEALSELAEEERDVAVIITDQRLPGMTGIDLLMKVAEKRPETLCIIMSSHTEVNVLVSAINRGLIYRYIAKPWKVDDMEIVLKETIKHYHNSIVNRRRAEQIKAINEYLKEEIRESRDYERIVGAGGGMRDVMEQVRRVAVASGNVLFRGEAGTGKELMARALHNLSPRRERALVKLTVASFHPRELESELFGVEKARGGAERAVRLGRLELAHGSAIFIEDIADLPIETQVKLARVLKERDFERLGGNETVRVDVRFIVSSQKNLEELIARRQFREELFNALSTFTIPIPPLRERKEDIPALAQHFADRHRKILGKGPLELDPGVMERLEDYYWPGNVLELENVMQRAVILATEGRIRAENLGFISHTGDRFAAEKEPPHRPLKIERGSNLKERLEEIEKIELLDALKKAGGHKANAARLLGINRSTMYYRMKKYSVSPK